LALVVVAAAEEEDCLLLLEVEAALFVGEELSAAVDEDGPPTVGTDLRFGRPEREDCATPWVTRMDRRRSESAVDGLLLHRMLRDSFFCLPDEYVL
jgi:hypothetical protein